MADRQELGDSVSEALANTPEPRNRKLLGHARRTEAVSMALAGLTYEQIGKELDISMQAAHTLVNRTIEETRNYDVDSMREIENARLDRAQSAIWSDVISGDVKAVNTFLRISERRAKMNGLDAPSKVQMSVAVRQEMQVALEQLEEVILEDTSNDTQAQDVVAQELEMATTQEYFTHPVTGDEQSA